MKKILLIATGGTIACEVTPQGLMPVLTAEELIKYVPHKETDCQISFRQICNMDSTNISPREWKLIVRCVRENYDAFDGFVITHGTDTMAYTSAALSYMIQNSPKPVVITGSQKPINDENSDARRNLSDSILYACDGESSGVVLIFGGKVIMGTRAKKTMARNFNAFESINFPVLAQIRDGHIIRFIRENYTKTDSSARSYEDSVRFYEEVNDSICVMKLIPGTRPELLTYLFENYDCIVIESFGVGGLPDVLSERFCLEMEKWERQGKFPVIATQVVGEGSGMELYQVGKQLKEKYRLIETYDMNLEAALTKLMWLMQQHGSDVSAIRRDFYRTVGYDILCAFSFS